jgi:hypothetical protein
MIMLRAHDFFFFFFFLDEFLFRSSKLVQSRSYDL